MEKQSCWRASVPRYGEQHSVRQYRLQFLPLEAAGTESAGRLLILPLPKEPFAARTRRRCRFFTHATPLTHNASIPSQRTKRDDTSAENLNAVSQTGSGSSCSISLSLAAASRAWTVTAFHSVGESGVILIPDDRPSETRSICLFVGRSHQFPGGSPSRGVHDSMNGEPLFYQ